MTWRGGASLVDAGFWRLRARHVEDPAWVRGAVSLLGEKANGGKNGVAMLAKQWGSWCGGLLAQAGMPVLLEGEKDVIACEKNIDGGCCVVTRAALRAAPTGADSK